MGDKAVAVAGLGSIGIKVARTLDNGMPGLRLAAVAASSVERAQQHVSEFRKPPQTVELEELPDHAEIVVECLPPELFGALAGPTLRMGRTLVAATVGGLLANPDILALARSGCGRIVVPSGAIAGLDALQAAKEAGLESVLLVTRKPLSAFEDGIAEDGQARCLFQGTAREAVARFPKNINVAASVSLAGLGPDRTEVEIWADPAVKLNTHELHIRSRTGEVFVRAANLPDIENPKSSAVTGHSIIAAVRRLADPINIG